MKRQKRIRRTNPAELVLMNPSNPAELVLMGTANPHRHHNSSQKYAIRWNTGNISHCVNSRGEAEKMLDQFHGAGMIIPVSVRHGNPMDTSEDAREIRSGFVGRESNRYIVMDEPHIPKGDYAQLGFLYSLAVKPTSGGEVREISFARGIRVISDRSRRQIYFAAGRQFLSTRELGEFSQVAADEINLGECREIIYLAKKYQAGVDNEAAGKTVEWRHKFGEETGILPRLWYDTKNNRLILRGGDYRVEDAGIVN